MNSSGLEEDEAVDEEDAEDKADEAVEELFESILYKYQNNLEKLIKYREFVLDYVHLLYYKCHKINLNVSLSYIDSPDWTKNKKATINPINEKDINALKIL